MSQLHCIIIIITHSLLPHFFNYMSSQILKCEPVIVMLINFSFQFHQNRDTIHLTYPILNFEYL